MKHSKIRFMLNKDIDYSREKHSYFCLLLKTRKERKSKRKESLKNHVQQKMQALSKRKRFEIK